MPTLAQLLLKELGPLAGEILQTVAEHARSSEYYENTFKAAIGQEMEDRLYIKYRIAQKKYELLQKKSSRQKPRKR